MELTQLLPLEKWGEIESELFNKYGLQGSVFNADGIRITNSKNFSNQLCPAIKSIDKGQSFICAVAHMNLSNQARQTKIAVMEECDAGLLKLVIPIFSNDEYLGVIGGCGLLPEDGEVDVFAVNKITEMDEKKIETLSSGIPTISRETLKSACNYIEKALNSALQDFKTVSP